MQVKKSFAVCTMHSDSDDSQGQKRGRSVDDDDADDDNDALGVYRSVDMTCSEYSAPFPGAECGKDKGQQDDDVDRIELTGNVRDVVDVNDGEDGDDSHQSDTAEDLERSSYVHGGGVWEHVKVESDGDKPVSISMQACETTITCSRNDIIDTRNKKCLVTRIQENEACLEAQDTERSEKIEENALEIARVHVNEKCMRILFVDTKCAAPTRPSTSAAVSVLGGGVENKFFVVDYYNKKGVWVQEMSSVRFFGVLDRAVAYQNGSDNKNDVSLANSNRNRKRKESENRGSSVPRGHAVDNRIGNRVKVNDKKMMRMTDRNAALEKSGAAGEARSIACGGWDSDKMRDGFSRGEGGFGGSVRRGGGGGGGGSSGAVADGYVGDADAAMSASAYYGGAESSRKYLVKTRKRGIIMQWFEAKGYGFVQEEDSRQGIFLHISQVSTGQKSLEIGQNITYELYFDKKTKKNTAVDVCLVSESGDEHFFSRDYTEKNQTHSNAPRHKNAENENDNCSFSFVRHPTQHRQDTRYRDETRHDSMYQVQEQRYHKQGIGSILMLLLAALYSIMQS